jgi:hypothetical protein
MSLLLSIALTLLGCSVLSKHSEANQEAIWALSEARTHYVTLSIWESGKKDLAYNHLKQVFENRMKFLNAIEPLLSGEIKKQVKLFRKRVLDSKMASSNGSTVLANVE